MKNKTIAVVTALMLLIVSCIGGLTFTAQAAGTQTGAALIVRSESNFFDDNTSISYANGIVPRQVMVDYYLDILEDAARHHLLVDFHGCTIPRGWSRTWPNLMSMEAVYGAEWYNNNRRMTNAAAAHNATLPFTRNVIGPMDYTPCTFTDSQNPHITTDCHELALPILFESGLQHMADRPEAYLNLPEQVRSLLSGLPSAWDDTRLLAGYPGQSAVIARRSGDTWYIAGINGTNEELTIEPDYSRIAESVVLKTLITDRGSEPGKGFNIGQNVKAGKLTLPARGGFVAIF